MQATVEFYGGPVDGMRRAVEVKSGERPDAEFVVFGYDGSTAVRSEHRYRLADSPTIPPFRYVYAGCRVIRA